MKEGDWITNSDGIGQIVSTRDYYIEDFYLNDSPDKKVGEYSHTGVVYKVFCNFSGKPKRSNFFKYGDLEYANALNDEYKKVLELAKSQYPKEYSKFLLREPNKPITSAVDFTIRVDPHNRSEIVKSINLLIQKLDKPFTYDEFKMNLSKDVKGLLTDLTYGDNSFLRTNVLVGLKYDTSHPQEKKLPFVGGIALETYCGFDEHNL